MRPFLSIMNSCRFFRLLCLEHWHKPVKDYAINPFYLTMTRGRMQGVKGKMLDVLDECIEQMRHAMRVAELRARA